MPVLANGQRLGSYTIGSLLGRGGMAEVYRATHVTLERDVAIKVLNPALNADPSFPLRFLREAKAVARLNHPHIITIYDFGEQGELAYLVMELAPGGTMREHVRDLVTLQQAVEQLAPICAALSYAHERGIVHRDIKPINVLFDEQQQPRLADFGLARIVSESLDLTATGAVLGSPHYLAPEQALAGRVDHRADIYSLGIITYEIITGRLPYTGPTPYAVIQQHLTAPAPSIRQVLPDAPASLDAAILRATAKRPDVRFDSAAGYLAELRSAAAEAPALPIRPGAGTALAVPADISEATLTLPPSPPGTAPSQSSVFRANSQATLSLPVNAGRGPVPLVASIGQKPGRRLRRSTSFTEVQWLAFGTLLLAVVFINAVGLWLARAGQAAASGSFGEGVTTYISSHLGAFKSSLTAFALLLAVLAVVSMRAAIVDSHSLAPETYRRFRQYHRLVGYSAVVIALAIGLLTCLGIFGFGTYSPRVALHSVLGTALLAVIVVKIAIVRYFPSQRQHLKLLGESLLVLFFLVFATSTIPFLWSHIAGTSTSNPYHPYVGRAAPQSIPGPGDR